MTTAELIARLPPLRRQLESLWAEYAAEKSRPRHADGTMMCKYTSAFLELVLGQPWRYAGGEPRYNPVTNHFSRGGGFFDGKAWRGHNWVTDGTLIVDLTANQFGADDIIITTAADPRYRENFSRRELQDSRNRVIARAELWASQCALYEAAEAV